jgi:RimJ/RimL family protein N-acetyltransferase
MTEALKTLIAWALKQEEIYRIWAVCDVDNLASARVMEKAGMQLEGILRRWSVHPNISAEPRDSCCYAIVK